MSIAFGKDIVGDKVRLTAGKSVESVTDFNRGPEATLVMSEPIRISLGGGVDATGWDSRIGFDGVGVPWTPAAV